MGLAAAPGSSCPSNEDSQAIFALSKTTLALGINGTDSHTYIMLHCPLAMELNIIVITWLRYDARLTGITTEYVWPTFTNLFDKIRSEGPHCTLQECEQGIYRSEPGYKSTQEFKFVNNATKCEYIDRQSPSNTYSIRFNTAAVGCNRSILPQ